MVIAACALVLGSCGSGSTTEQSITVDSAGQAAVSGSPPEETEFSEADGEVRRFEGSFAFTSENEDAQNVVLIDRVTLEAGDTLSGSMVLLATMEVLEDTFECIYVSYELDGVPMFGDGVYSGTATGEGAFPDGPCAGTTPPPVGLAVPVAVEATIEGDSLTVALTGPGEDEALILLATLVEP